MNYFTADIHFCDEDTMKEENRPFKTIDDYNNYVVNNWNKTAGKNDTIYVVGDLFDCNGEHSKQTWLDGLKLVKKVKAHIVLILGNNEQRIINYFFNKNLEAFKNICYKYGIKEVYEELDVKTAKHTFHLVHQIKDGNPKKINLFGHTHLCSGVYHPYGLCVSTDLNHFRLFTEEILEGYLKRKKDFWEADDNVNYVNPFLKEVNGKIININSNNKAYQKYLKSYF